MADIAVTAAATLSTPLVNLGLKALKSIVQNPTASRAEMHKALNDGLKDLLASRSDKDREVALSDIQKEPSHVYMRWKESVSNIEKEVASLNEKYEAGRKKRYGCKGRDPDKETIKRALNEVIKLTEKCPDKILVDKLPERVIKEIGLPSIADYPTLKEALENIQTLLQINSVKCVALYGQKGVGKTIIVQHLNNYFYDSVDKLFDMVIFVKVSADEQTKDLHILQKIADRIKVDREGNEFEVAGRIQRVLVNKRYLLILDGVRRTADGIWQKLDISRDKKDSKVVITTSYPLARKSKCVNRNVDLKKLSPPEAWKMFRDIVGDNYLPHLPTARLVCKRFCSGLPLLIDPIAKSFKYQESPPDWQKALNEWTPWPQVGIDELKELYSKLELCYQLLGDRSKQKCFLYASLYPANSKIYTDYLVECCIVQGFLGAVDTDAKYSGMRSRAITTILRHLVNVAFLEEGEQMRYVKMNDLYRQLALYISSKDSECRTYVDDEERQESFRSELWQQARWVSMVGTNRNILPENQTCGSLQTLLLQKNLELVEIPPAYFDSMGNLLVLNLYRNKIRRLPSLSGLARLKAFYLNGCSDLIIYPSQIQPLKHLEIFDVRDTGVNFVPCLESLRCLRISYIASSNYQGISELRKLEELTIEVKFLQQWCRDAENILSEVASLENLSTFRCGFPSSEILGKFLETSKSWRGKKQFTSFQFFVGCEISKRPKIIESFKDRIFKYVKYCNGDKKDDLAITEILSQAEAFELICHNNVANLCELARSSNLEYLRILLIDGCNQMLVVVRGDLVCNAINGTLPNNASLLPNLDQLHLDNLRDVRCVFRGPFHPGSFSMLHTLTLKNCPELTSIFFNTAADEFPELQKLVVQDCSKIEVLISGQSILPKLKILTLDNLLNFKSICPNKNLAWSSLERLNVQNCPELKALPFNTTNAAKLRTIKGEKEWWSNLEWTPLEVHKRFESTFSVST
ncbi:disease resistance protein At4g27190-like [Neltuma alba]|uniref:disease resistance protein At4g27190-like n=1 Tax=Neltuma alba TaxID=207710 RepID=UPI0010A53B18|nr:disease resistance protein At4g27190-like [Prosopis alba]